MIIVFLITLLMLGGCQFESNFLQSSNTDISLLKELNNQSRFLVDFDKITLPKDEPLDSYDQNITINALSNQIARANDITNSYYQLVCNQYVTKEPNWAIYRSGQIENFNHSI